MSREMRGKKERAQTERRRKRLLIGLKDIYVFWIINITGLHSSHIIFVRRNNNNV